MKSNNTYKINQIIDMFHDTLDIQYNILDTMAERIDDMERAMLDNKSENSLTEEEKKYKKEWVCQVCKKSTFETDYDYIVHPKLCLGCALKEEWKGKGIKEQYHEASARWFKEGNKGPDYDSKGNSAIPYLPGKYTESVEEPEGTPYTPEETDAWNRAVEDCGTQQTYDKYRRKLSEEIVEDKEKKYIYESYDGGKTIYKREFQKSDRSIEHMKSKYKDFKDE